MTETVYPFEPARYGVSSVTANVCIDDDRGEKWRHRNERHVHVEISPCNTVNR